MIDYRYLKAFSAAATHLNFGRAAKDLRISPSALSRQIALLEQSSGSEIFIRNTRQVALTAFGKKLFTSVRKFDEELKAINSETPLRIGCLESVFEFFLVDLMGRYPGYFKGAIDITIGSSKELEKQAVAADLDLAITNQAPSASSNLSGFRIFPESLSWIGTTKQIHSTDRVIIFSAFESSYSSEEVLAENRIRVNSFNAAITMTRRKLGRSLVALPSHGQTGEHLESKQWIYALMPNYRRVPERLGKLVALLKRQTVSR